jgi:transposase InsO family protein
LPAPSGAALRAKAPPFGYLARLDWQSDFTSIETAEGWLLLAFTIDACARRRVAHHARPDMRGELTTTTLTLAIRRHPPPPGLLHHSDRGV